MFFYIYFSLSSRFLLCFLLSVGDALGKLACEPVQTWFGSHSQALLSYPLSFFQLFHFLSPKWRLWLSLTTQSPPLRFAIATSTTEEALHHAIRFAFDGKRIDSMLLKFWSRLCESDDYTFLLWELGKWEERTRAIQCFEFAVQREQKHNKQGKWVSAMISILSRLGQVELAKECVWNLFKWDIWKYSLHIFGSN